MMLRRSIQRFRWVSGFFSLACLLCSGNIFAKGSYPEWIAEAMKSTSAYGQLDEDASGLYLLNELSVAYEGRGMLEKSRRVAIHIRTRDARNYGSFGEVIHGRSDKLRDFKAWIVYPSGKVESFRRKDLYEVALGSDQLYSDSKTINFDRSSSMRNGAIFAYEYTISRKTSFLQGVWDFQAELPVVSSRAVVEVPDKWRVDSRVFNSSDVRSTKNANRYVWEVRDLEALPDEPNQPFRSLLAATLCYSVVPDEQELKRYSYISFENWNDVANFALEAQKGKDEPDEAISAKSRELTATASSDWERIKAIGSYAQSVNYVAMSINLNSGGGYRPRPAPEVFEKHYGDCKDMTSLARAMLTSVGIDSYPVLAGIGGTSWVHDEWASPYVFDHCILAVPVGDEAPDVSGVVDHPKHGRIAIFDPTSKVAAFGVMPYYLRGRKVLVSSPWDDEMLSLPFASPEDDRVERECYVTLDESGALSGTITERNTGRYAQRLRHLRRSKSNEELEEFVELWIRRGVYEAEVERIECRDFFEENVFELVVEFSARRYARFMKNGELLFFRPVFLEQQEWVPPVDKERITPYVSRPLQLDERTVFVLPDGFILDSKNEEVSQLNQFADYDLDISVSGREVEVRRTRTIEYRVTPPEDYQMVIDFYEAVVRAESALLAFKREL